jgi:hypothetical protein
MERGGFENNRDSDNSDNSNTSSQNSSEKASQFKYKDSLFLYLLYEGFKCGVLTSEEKIKMKELIWIQHPIIYELLKKYESSGQVLHFWTLVKKCISNEEYESGTNMNISSISSNSRLNLEIESDLKDESHLLKTCKRLNNSNERKLNNLSSPGDCALIRQKKIKLIKSKNKIQVEFLKEDSEKSNKESDCSNLSTENVSQNSEIFIKTCKKGGSPYIEVKKKVEDMTEMFREEEKEMY